MCGAHAGPDHDDPAASDLCDAYHEFTGADLPVLEATLSAREKEIAWHTALGIGPDALAGRLGADPGDLRSEIRGLTQRLHDLRAAS